MKNIKIISYSIILIQLIIAAYQIYFHVFSSVLFLICSIVFIVTQEISLNIKSKNIFTFGFLSWAAVMLHGTQFLGMIYFIIVAFVVGAISMTREWHRRYDEIH
jgi:hypothetical protein